LWTGLNSGNERRLRPGHTHAGRKQPVTNKQTAGRWIRSAGSQTKCNNVR
jgi:hypothetical protein